MNSLWQAPVVVVALLTWLNATPTSFADAAQREALRKLRGARRDERLSKQEKRARRREERRAQAVYRGLLVYAAAIATVVIVVGLCEREVDFVRDGIVCLCAVCGLSLFRLRSFGTGLKGL